ncbi:Mce family protein [Gordonia hirsuta DSM 44140 = NBRC 16056]|uniref:Mce family protein n=1 Tax=Gordonia hirsuta DSM 44140 = NBRC 16056 TaxID=1121927 RepID=L7LDI1_9ACTN|nr:MlaD family protein [Gordonia hirsuta]GAC58093.1 Mce family protein [Gordonia hirsuta DSM 44140 = NBRC 16056]
MKTAGTRAAALKVLVFSGIVVACMVLIVNSIRTPVPGVKNEFTAMVSDVSGLYEGNDVRMSGVQVGKVESIELAGAVARVRFSVQEDHSIYDNTKIAVRYQNLVGQRYLELIRAERDGPVLPAGTTISEQNTIPSFDVSQLFNGFAPLFDTIEPDALNRFGQNMLNVIQGDGSGFGGLLDDVRKLASMANDRQKLVLVILRNLDNVSKSIVGKSQQIGDFVRELDFIAGDLDTRADQIHSSAVTANKVVKRGADLLDQLQAAYDDTYGPLHDFLFRLTPLAKEIQTALRLLPSLITGMNNGIKGTTTPVNYTCSKGRSGLPGIGSVVLANQRLVVCK